MWWPHPDAFSDLTVEDTEGGWEFSAPDESECGQWLSFYSQSEELSEEFQREVISCLLNHCDKINGESKIPNRTERDRVHQEEDSSGAVPTY